MYAIVELQGKQFKIKEGTRIAIPYLGDETKEGDECVIDKVLFCGGGEDGKKAIVGTPYLLGVAISARVTNPLLKDKKVIVYKFKRRKDYHKKQGHRQKYTEIEISQIALKEAS